MKILSLFRLSWSIDELRQKMYYTLMCILVFILTSYVIIPGVVLYEGVLNTSYTSMAALGLAPYVTSTALMSFFNLNETQRLKYSRILAILISVFQAPTVYTLLKSYAIISPNGNTLFFTLIIVSTTALYIYISEKISEKGVCDGRDLLMGVTTMLLLPQAIFNEFSVNLANGKLLLFIFALALLFLAVAIALLICQSLVAIPIQVLDEEGVLQKEECILMKINPLDDYPINFSIAISFILLAILSGFQGQTAISDLTNYVIIVILTFVSTFILVARRITPDRVLSSFLELKSSENVEINPNKLAINHELFDKIIYKSTLLAALFLSFLVVLPLLSQYCGVSPLFGTLIGGTSIIFVVNCIVGTLHTFDDYLYQYGFETFEGYCKGRLIGKAPFLLPDDSDQEQFGVYPSLPISLNQDLESQDQRDSNLKS